MPHVNFYILPDNQLTSLLQYACKLAEKHWLSGQRVLIQTDSVEDSKTLNDLLWSVREDSFIPHGIASLEPVDQQQPILISHQKVSDNNFLHIVNLSSRAADIKPEADQMDKFVIEELLNQDEKRKKSGRQHYKIYRESGYTLEHHTLETNNG